MSRPLERILYVEDDPDLQAIVMLALGTVGGFTVQVCSSGREVVQKAKAFKPDLMLLDVMMPDMDGPSTLQALRGVPDLAGLPVIFITAKVQVSELAQLKSLGALDVIAKPFDPMRLAPHLREIWQRGVA